MALFELESIVPRNPIEVAEPFAYEVSRRPDFGTFGHSIHETEAVRRANLSMMAFNMIGEYEVSTNLAFVIPKDETPDEFGNVQLERKDLETCFVGDFVGNRTLKIGHIVGHGAVRAFCLAFEDVLIKYRRAECNAIIPQNEMIEEKDRLLVPVFAMSEMTQTG